MDVEMKRSSQVPAFGSWECNDADLSFTQCFETAARPTSGALRYSYSGDHDLYLSGDLYQNHIVTPAMIIVPRRPRQGNGGYKNVKKEREMVSEYGGYDVKEAPSRYQTQLHGPAAARRNKAPAASKAVDEDLYQISPNLLYATTKKKRGFGLFSCCMEPSCEF
ncbi:Pathogenic type III effector avirulence factor Avr cleavage site-containing protein [Heracleum sosnowskyi]|uniref:Pathogenic type III effector avirulence factor Avr cleavage site-containing protein n=1 Tax=Heracleum sosnowskyi TaxID=360622 RepID=A0AAD8GRY4_9APIA|nr:Pathogenic type III effector avirulence factor Avr cleavage site-containing protein [Heracleum sosnowskyi]